MSASNAQAIADRTPGWLTTVEGLTLYKMARAVPADQHIVEVGTYMGKSTAWLAEGSSDGMHAPITTIDPWRVADVDWYTDSSSEEMEAAFYFTMQGGGWGDLVTHRRATSLEVAAEWHDPIGLCFVDSVHEYEAAKDDFAAWSQLIVPGGALAFHDYSPAWQGVVKALVESELDGWSKPRIYDSLWTVRRDS